MIRMNSSALCRSAKRLRRSSDQVLDGLALKAAERLVREATERTPVDTGRLRAGWTAAQTGPHAALVKNSVEYASFVEFDTRHWISGNIVPGQLFMRRAMEETEAALPGMVEERLQEAIGEVFW